MERRIGLVAGLLLSLTSMGCDVLFDTSTPQPPQPPTQDAPDSPPERPLAPRAAISLSDSALNFGLVDVGASHERALTLKNTGQAPMRVQPLRFAPGSSDEFALRGPEEAIQIAPGSERVWSVRYNPATPSATAVLIVLCDDPTAPQLAIPIEGKLATPALSVSTLAVDFGAVGRGSRASREIALVNRGNAALNIENLSLSNSPNFDLDTLSAPVSLAPEQSLRLAVHFAPKDLRNTSQGSLSFTTNDPTRPEVTIALMGQTAVSPQCAPTLDAEHLAFGHVGPGESLERTLQVTNRGAGDCVFGREPQLSAPFDLSAAPEAGDRLGPGQKVALTVRFDPLRAQSFTSALDLGLSNADEQNKPVYCALGLRCQDNPLAEGCGAAPECGATLSGLSGPRDLSALPTSIDFGRVSIGCKARVRTVEQFGLAQDQRASFRLEEGCDGTFEVLRTPDTRAQLSWQPQTHGLHTCALIVDAEGASEQRVPLRGHAVDSARTTDHFSQPERLRVDILVLIDASGSMGARLSQLIAGLGTLGARIAENAVDARIAVAHIGLGESRDYRGSSFVAGEAVGEPPALSVRTAEDLMELAGRLGMPAIGGGTASAFEAALLALSDPLTTRGDTACQSREDCEAPYDTCLPEGLCGGRHATIFRPDTPLEIIVISDDDDRSQNTTAFTLAALRQRAGSAVRISVLGGFEPDTLRPEACDNASAATRYAQAVQETGGTRGSICADSFRPFVQTIANRITSPKRRFELSSEAIPDSIRINVGQENILQGWSHDPSTRTIHFEPGAEPPAGAEIAITYNARCL